MTEPEKDFIEATKDNPFSVDEIEPRLFLGNCTAARNIDFLKAKKIRHILTIDSAPIPNYVVSATGINNKYIHISDMSRENILEHFTEAISFIEDAFKDPKGDNCVLVHCFYGVSRSATIVIAYLMQKYSISYQKAFERAKSKRSLVSPNNGFVKQLKLFYKMGYKIDPSYKNYKIFRLKLAADQVRSARILPSSFMNLLSPDPGLMQERPEPHVYRCRKCRRIVASKSNLITHKPENHENFSPDSPSGKGNQLVPQPSPLKLYENALNDQAGNSTNCEDIEELTQKMITATLSNKSLTKDQEVCTQTFFVEPMAWMKDVINNVEGKLYCPSCKSKIGSFNWLMASKCPCGKQVSPSFYLVPSKIDYSNVVQNIKQVTV